MPSPTVLLDASAIDRSLKRLAHQIVERETDLSQVTLVGIKRRGVPLAIQLRYYLSQLTGLTVDFGELDIQLYRDDLTEMSPEPKVAAPDLAADLVAKRTVILVDDVIYTGRTARAAIDAVMDCARPARVRLLTLIDRGHREMPIRPDYVGKNIPTSVADIVVVETPPFDSEKQVRLLSKTGAEKPGKRKEK